MKIVYNNLSFNIEQFTRIFAEEFLACNSKEFLLKLTLCDFAIKVTAELRHILSEITIDNIPGDKYYNDGNLVELSILHTLILSKLFLISLEKNK
jgi:hypothetical protein